MDNATGSGRNLLKQEYALFHSPSLLLAVIAITIFFTEMMVMAIISFLPGLPSVYIFSLDSTLLILIIFPVLYFLVLHPIKMHMAQRIEAEKQLNSSLEELRHLSNHLQTLQEEERKRIATEIHDELGQSLTALKMELFECGKRLPVPMSEQCGKLCSRVDELIKTVKRITTELRPSVLDNFGLAAAIEWQVEKFRQWAGIDCNAVIDFNESRFSGGSAIALFRIVQESLTNIARHSGAKYARVIIREKDGHVVLKVTDDGDGIPQHKVLEPESMGLIGVRERVNALGGKIRMRGIPGKGTGIYIIIPIPITGGCA